MKKDFWVLLFLTILVFSLWHKALFNFFAQDDFILINQFSQNGLWQNLKNTFGPPQVTHWRPIHNLYFLVTGNIFSKHYFGYHIFTFILHIGVGFFVYKTVKKLANDSKTALTAGVIYAVHPAHFVSLFWISGGATTIGFFFLIISFYYFLIDKKNVSLMSYVISLLASEAMVVGLAIFACFEVLFKRGKIDKLFLTIISGTSVIFLILRFVLLTPETTFDIYRIELSTKVFPAIKYYLLRIAGFAEVSGDQVVSIALLGWLALIALLLIKKLSKKQNVDQLVLSIAIIIIGLFPFVLIPQHLSPHYMNISIFGFSMLVGTILKNTRPIVTIIIVSIFLIITAYNIDLTQKNNWVVKKSNLAKAYIEQIKKENPNPESQIVFADNKISTSQDAYIALGTDQAIDFWFSDKNYQTCFAFLENCAKQ